MDSKTAVAALCGLLTLGATSAAPQADERKDSDRAIEITAKGSNLWHLKTRSRLVHLKLLEREGKTFAEFLPFDYEGAPFPFADGNRLSLEMNAGTGPSRSIPLLREGEGGRLVTSAPLPSRSGFDAALVMNEGDHVHRLRFRFPGAP